MVCAVYRRARKMHAETKGIIGSAVDITFVGNFFLHLPPLRKFRLITNDKRFIRKIVSIVWRFHGGVYTGTERVAENVVEYVSKRRR